MGYTQKIEPRSEKLSLLFFNNSCRIIALILNRNDGWLVCFELKQLSVIMVRWIDGEAGRIFLQIVEAYGQRFAIVFSWGWPIIFGNTRRGVSLLQYLSHPSSPLLARLWSPVFSGSILWNARSVHWFYILNGIRASCGNFTEEDTRDGTETGWG